MDKEELYAALRNADAAGDTAGAQRLAEYIQTLPTEDAGPQRAGATPGVANARAPQAEPSGLEKFARGAERIVTGDVSPEEYGRVGENFVRSVTGPLGGDVVAAAGSALAGKGFNPDEQRARREELAAENPVTAGAAELLGAGGVGKLVAPLKGGILTQGAVTGAVTAANESGGDVAATAGGAAAGAVGGKVLEKLAEGFQPLAALAKRLKGPNGKPVDPRELQATFKQLETDLGRKPTIVELASAQSTKALTKLAEGRRGAMETFTAAQEARSAARPAELSDAITRGQSTTGEAEMLAARDDAFTAAMTPIERRAGLVQPREAQILMHPDVIGRMDDTARQKLEQAIITTKPAFLTVRDADTIRRTLGQAVQAAQRDGANFQPLTLARATARLIGERISPEYRAALAQYEGRSDMARGAATGARIRSASSGDLMDASVRLNAPEAQGVRTGARKALSEAAAASDTGAVRTARELTEPGTQAKLAATMGPDEAARLRRVGTLETTGARNFADITKQGVDEVIDPTDVKKIAGLAATAALKTKSPGVFVSGAAAILKPLKGLGLAPGVGRKIAELATSENGAEKVIPYLRKARVGEASVQKIAKAIGIPLGAAMGTNQ